MLSKLKVLWRERKERIAEKKLAEADPPGVTVPLSLVRSAKLASWLAYFALVYFLWLYTLDIAGARSASLHITHAGGWIGDLNFYFPYIVGFAVVAIGIPYVAKIAIPTFMSLNWSDNAWAKGWALFIVLCVSSVIIAGTFTVQGDTILERDREGVVAVDTVRQEAAVQQARIDDAQHRLDEMTRSPSVYVQTAASMSPQAYEAWMEARRNDWQYERFVAYRQTSIDAQRLRDEISRLRDEQARATVTSAVEGRVTTGDNDWIAATLGWLEGARAMLLSFVMDIVCLIMPWIALRLEQARNRQIGVAGGMAQHPWMLNDLRAEAAVRDDPARDARDVAEAMVAGGADPRFAADMARSASDRTARQSEMYDAETGQRLIWRKGTWVKPPTKLGGKQEGAMQMPSGDGVIDGPVAHDGGNRMASSPAGPIDVGAIGAIHEVHPVAAPEASDEGEQQAETPESEQVHPEPSDEDAAAALMLLETPVDETNALEDDLQGDGEEQHAEDDHGETPEREEPETDPARMIAAE